jgi:hypothetical protein
MESLSNVFKRSAVFQGEFDKVFPEHTFNKTNILSYITNCTGLILDEMRHRYPDHNVRFINPVFIVDNEIFPAANLPGDTTILKLTRPFFELLESGIIVSLSLPILENLLSGVCLCFGDTYNKYDYKLFKSCNLDQIIPDAGLDAGDVKGRYMIDNIVDLKIDLSKLSYNVKEFAYELSANTDEEKVRLIKTLILYRDISKALSDSLVFSFVNRYNQTHSFFDCPLTFISDRPFDEDQLLDLANITEGVSLPIVNFDMAKSKAISAATMAKRNALRGVFQSVRATGTEAIGDTDALRS